MTVPDPVDFISQLIDPATGQPFQLYEQEVRFAREAFTLTPEGRLPYSDAIFSGPKKSGKSGFGALSMLFVTLATGEPFAEGFCLANSLDQSAGRVFQQISRIVRATPALRKMGRLLENRIEFESGGVIQAVPAAYAGQAGSNPTIACFDELWAYTGEAGTRLFEEMSPSPARRVSCRLVVTFAGFSGESKLLEGLYNRAMAGEQIGPDLYRTPDLLCYWTHDLHAPWQTEAWRERMRASLRPSAYTRMIENRWASGEEAFIPIEWWDRATVAA